MNFLFCVHPTRAEAKRLHAELTQLILSHGAFVTDDPRQADYTVAIGGDGTVVSAYTLGGGPIIGVNAGTLGYLTRIEPTDAAVAIESVIERAPLIEKRMTLNCVLPSGDTINALNEVALLKPDTGIIRFNVSVDGIELMRYTADGIIAATPTGSTGYSLSAGGPIVDPTGEMLILTPVSPHTLVNRPIVLSHKSSVCLTTENDALLAADGYSTPLPAGSKIQIQKAARYAEFVVFGKESFIGRLRKKLS